MYSRLSRLGVKHYAVETLAQRHSSNFPAEIRGTVEVLEPVGKLPARQSPVEMLAEFSGLDLVFGDDRQRFLPSFLVVEADHPRLDDGA